MKKEKMEKNILVSVIITSLIVAVLASVATLAVSGNAILVGKGTAGPVYTISEVYNKAQIDTMFKGIGTEKSYLLRTTITRNVDTGKTLTTITDVVKNNDICIEVEIGRTCTIDNYMLKVTGADYPSKTVTLAVTSLSGYISPATRRGLKMTLLTDGSAQYKIDGLFFVLSPLP